MQRNSIEIFACTIGLVLTSGCEPDPVVTPADVADRGGAHVVDNGIETEEAPSPAAAAPVNQDPVRPSEADPVLTEFSSGEPLQPSVTGTQGEFFLCGERRSVWLTSARDTNLVEPAFLAIRSDRSDRRKLCVDLLLDSETYKSEAKVATNSGERLLTATLRGAVLEIWDKDADDADPRFAPHLLNRAVSGALVPVCFHSREDLSLTENFLETRHIRISYAMYTETSETQSCELFARLTRSWLQDLDIRTPTARGTPEALEVLMTREQLMQAAASGTLLVEEVCDTGAPEALRNRTEALAELFLEHLEFVSSTWADVAEHKPDSKWLNDVGAKVEEYLKEKNKELKTKKETEFDTDNEAEAGFLGLGGKGKIKVRKRMLEEDLKKLEQKVQLKGDLLIPGKVNYTAWSATGSGILGVIRTSVRLSQSKDKVSIIRHVPIFEAKPAKRLSYVEIVPVKTGRHSVRKTPRAGYEAVAVSYHCTHACGWSYAVRRNRSDYFTRRRCRARDTRSGDHWCEYGADYDIDPVTGAVTVYRSKDAGPANAWYEITWRMKTPAPMNVCPNVGVGLEWR